MNLKIVILILCVTFALAQNVENPVIKTKFGTIKGSLMTSRLGKKIYAFRGIRYGKPPIGHRRFKEPELINPWEDTFDASKEGPSCIRLEAVNPSEDCLALNIYTTKLSTPSYKVKQPVIVFFPPGGFNNFSAQSYIYGPQYYLDQDVVLVTVNYRLGFLGFASTGDHRAPGNLGLKDQVVALRFIQQIIDAFGGDPNSVTITGYSAGGWSVIFHMLSPMSRGLFHKAVAMSGTPVKPKLLPYEQKDQAIKQARLLQCPTNHPDIMFECLMRKPAMDFAHTLPEFKEFYTDPDTIFSPVVEPEIPGVERFTIAQPADTIRSGNFNHVPLVLGSTLDETVTSAFRGIEDAKRGNDSYFQDLDREWEHVAPICFQYERDTEHSKAASKEIRKFYFGDEPISLSNAKSLAKIYGDGIVASAVHRTAGLMAKYNREPVYYYKFVYQGRYSHLMYNDTNKPYGVVHFDDLMYIFYISYKIPFFQNDDPEVPMIEKMTAIWTNFAKTGQPIPKNNQLFENVKWEALTTENRAYLEISNELRMKSNLNPDRYGLWARLFPLPPVKPTNSKPHRVPSNFFKSDRIHTPSTSSSPLISSILHMIFPNF